MPGLARHDARALGLSLAAQCVCTLGQIGITQLARVQAMVDNFFVRPLRQCKALSQCFENSETEHCALKHQAPKNGVITQEERRKR